MGACWVAMLLGTHAYASELAESAQSIVSSLYPALHRLERRGLITSEWRESESERMAKFYSLTKAGKAQLTEELEQWSRYVSAISWVLET